MKLFCNEVRKRNLSWWIKKCNQTDPELAFKIVLSHLLALRNTAGCVSMRVGADYGKVMKSKI